MDTSPPTVSGGHRHWVYTSLVRHAQPPPAPREIVPVHDYHVEMERLNRDLSEWRHMTAPKLEFLIPLLTCCTAGSRRPPTAHRPRPPPPCPSRSLGPSDLRWRPPTPPSRTPCSGTLRRRGSAGRKRPTKTDVDFPNQTPTQTVSLIPTPRLYTEDRTSL